jgi:chemotaxis protein MotA
MVQTPFFIFRRSLKILPWIIKPPHLQFDEYRILMANLSRKARQMGLLCLEEHLEIESNPLIYKGLELLLIGVDKQTIRQVLETEVERVEQQDITAANVYESMGGYSPTIGILGAVMGLIQVMRNLAEPSAIGLGIATSFVATLYGVGLANLVFIPISCKLKNFIARQVHFDGMIVEAFVAMASGESPTMLMLKISNFGRTEHDENKT